MKTNFTYKCWEALERSNVGFFDSCNGKRIPLLIKKGGVKRVIGRKILEANQYLGSYGMGGPGFFGLKLEEKSHYPEEWLVLTVWRADEWLLVNNKWLDYPRDLYTPKDSFCEMSPYFSESKNQINSIFSNLIVGDFKLYRQSFKMILQDVSRVIKLELPSELTRLPPHGNGCNRKWCKGEKLESGLLISPTQYINI